MFRDKVADRYYKISERCLRKLKDSELVLRRLFW